jgi:DNA-binding NtrC family response regulator
VEPPGAPAGRRGGEEKAGVPELEAILGESAAIAEVRGTIGDFSGRAFKSVLVRGETGVGKELAAAAIRACSSWRRGPFEALSAPAVPPDQLESELFGTVRGAFTGALERRGLVEHLDGGVLFIDEVAAMRLEHQAKLLRFIDTGSARRLGSNHSYRVELGLLAATNEDLEEKIEAGEFREDLYYRLVQDGVVWVPPLRDRGDDVVLLADACLASFGAFSLAPSAVKALREHPWPGNVRELRAVCRRVARALCSGAVEGEDVWRAIEELGSRSERLAPVAATCGKPDPCSGELLPLEQTFEAATEVFQRRLLLQAYQLTRGNLTEAGILLGFDRARGGHRVGSGRRQARQLAHRRFTYWYQRLVGGRTPDT